MTDTTSLSFFPLLHVPLSKIYVCDDDFNGTGSLYVENDYVDTPTPVFVGDGQPSILSIEWQPGPGNVTSMVPFLKQPIIKVYDNYNRLMTSVHDVLNVELVSNNRVQTLSCEAHGRNFRLEFNSEVTPSISYDANAITVLNALLDISTILNASVRIYENGYINSAAKACTPTGITEIVVVIISLNCSVQSYDNEVSACHDQRSIVPEIRLWNESYGLMGNRSGLSTLVASH